MSYNTIPLRCLEQIIYGKYQTFPFFQIQEFSTCIHHSDTTHHLTSPEC